MKNIIAGTAGHIDHGKTALVRALTGIDTDRLEEEKRRGISIDLGFAHLALGEVQVGFIDVPGHERFVRNMLAGVGGIDLVLLVVAADESIKPQTREHFEICRLLGVARGLVVLTKADLVDEDLLALVKMEVEEFVAGSFLEGAPIVPVSARTGAGLELLRTEVGRLAAQAAARDSEGIARLPVDRSFSMRGFGTVVTGTLIAGSLRVEDEIEVHPVGLRLRIRGLQVHGKGVERAFAGQRTAVNLAGVEASQLSRGMVLAPPGLLRPTQFVDTEFQLLQSAQPLKHRAPIHFHSGTAEVEAEVRLLESTEAMRPGSTGWVRLILRDPVLLVRGDRFIARMFSPVITIGGGIVADNHPPRRLRRAASVARLDALRTNAVVQLVRESAHGLALEELVARLGMSLTRVRQEAKHHQLIESGGTLIAPERLQAAVAALRRELTVFHKANPLLPGLPKAQVEVPPALLATMLAASPDIVAEADTLRLASHKLVLKLDEDQALVNMEGLFARAGLSVPATNEVLAQSGVEMARAKSLLQILMRQGKLVRVNADLLYHASAVAQLRRILESHKGQRFGVGEFKDWTGVSRKYAIPLLEYLDKERVTRREGEQRLVL